MLMATWARKLEDATPEDAMLDNERDEELQPLALEIGNLRCTTALLDQAMLLSARDGGGGARAQVHAMGQTRGLEPSQKGSSSRRDCAAA
jgi:hypothetical protein